MNNSIIDDKSYLAHNQEYEKQQFDFCQKQQAEFKKNRIEYESDKPIGKILDNNQIIKIGVDIGSGHGYFANLMAQTLDVVYAIEPSESAIEMSKRLYPNTNNIKWICGFAEEVLPTLKLNNAALFHTGCVLSHLEDEAVINICQKIESMAVEDSMLACSELWGIENHEHLWHCRTDKWWENQFPGWFFKFQQFSVQVPGRFKSFSAHKKTYKTDEDFWNNV